MSLLTRILGRSLQSTVIRSGHKGFTLKRLMSSDSPTLSQLLQQIENGSLSAKDAKQQILKGEISETMNGDNNIQLAGPNEVLASFANLDHGRSERTGFPEVSRTWQHAEYLIDVFTLIF